MSNKDEKIKDYSLGLQLGLILGVYVASLGISIFLVYKVSRQRISKIIFILSSIYASLFVYLNLMAIFDLFFNNHEGFHKLFKFLKKFYLGFTYADKLLGFILFNILIFYLESGYFANWKKVSDGIWRFFHSIKKLTIGQIVIILAIAIPIAGTLLVLLIIYRKHYNLGNDPFEYISILLDCYAVFKIYAGVGFFIYQLIKDCKIRKNKKLKERYYRYSTKKIIVKVNKYIKLINDTYDFLNKFAPIFQNDNSNPYHLYLQKYYNKVKQTKLELEGNNIMNDVIIYNDSTDNINNDSTNNNNTISPVNINNINKNEAKNYVQNLNKPKTLELPTSQNLKSTEIQTNSNKLKEKFETSEKIRKYKKAVRRIDKLKMLYSQIEKETIKGLTKECSCGIIILFITFTIALVTDFVLPLVFDYGSDEDYYNDDSDLFDKKQSTVINIIYGILGILVSAIFACPYTIITVYATIRKRYISGDFLYDKEINDDISLMKTVQLICGYSFAIVYCNLYYWKTIDYKGTLGKPYFYDKIIIPDYIFKQGISIYMTIKIILIVGSIFANLYLSDVFVFKNDLAEYNLCGEKCVYDDENDFNIFLNNNYTAKNILGIK